VESTSTHLLVLFDDAGRITSFGEIDQDAMDRDGHGRVSLAADGRHFAQLELTDELRSVSHEDFATQYVVDHFAGADARLVRRTDFAQ
jgi:hypothetical protein